MREPDRELHTLVEAAPEERTGSRGEAGGATYARRLTLFDGVMVVVGGIIGSGIFLSPAIVAQRVDTPGLILLAWATGGALALVGALCFGELGVRRPEAGGGYVYLKEAFGPLPGFLYGWMLLLVSNTGAIAALAIIFARYATELVGWPPASIVPLAVGAIVFLSGINYLGVRLGSLTQNVFTVLKLLALAGLIAGGLLFAGGASAAGPFAGEGGGSWRVTAFGAALIPVLFSYGGWQHANHIAGELRRPGRNLPRSLLFGVAVVVGVYLLANFVYLHVLGVEGLAASTAPASDVMERALGELGGTLIGAGVVASVFGILNLYILAAPRVYQAMAGDGLFFRRFARLHPRYRTPHGAIVLQAVWASVLAASGTFGQLLDYVVFGDWIFFALVVATLFVYRRRDRDAAPDAGADAPFRMIGYPWLPAVFILVSGFVVVSSIGSNPLNAAVGTLLIGAGIPVFWYWRRSASAGPVS